MAWNAYHTSGPPLHLQLSPTYPSGSTLINLRHLRDATRHAWILSIYPLYSGAGASESVFAVALHNGCPREAPRPSFLFSGRSGADSVRKSPLIYTQQLQRREVLLIGCSEIDVALPNFTCRGTWSIKTVPQKLVGSRTDDSGRNIHQQMCLCQCARALFHQKWIWAFASYLKSASMCPEPPASFGLFFF